MTIGPASGTTRVFIGQREGQELLSVVRGQREILPDGGMLITEFDAGRVLEVDKNGEIVWEYVNAFKDDFVEEITNAVLYPAAYFDVEFGACG